MSDLRQLKDGWSMEGDDLKLSQDLFQKFQYHWSE